MRDACERAKIELSNAPNVEIRVNQLAGGKDFLKRVTREQFEEWADPLFQRCKVPMQKAMLDAKMPLDEISDVVMVGGSSRIPKLVTILKEYFGEDIQINRDLNPDEVVARGATNLAGILSGRTNQNVILNDVTPLSLGMLVANEIEQSFLTRLWHGV